MPPFFLFHCCTPTSTLFWEMICCTCGVLLVGTYACVLGMFGTSLFRFFVMDSTYMFWYNMLSLIYLFMPKQIQSLEESAETLRERSLKFYKGCRKYT